MKEVDAATVTSRQWSYQLTLALDSLVSKMHP